MAKLVVLSEQIIEEILDLPECIRVVEAAFHADADGGVQTFPIVRETLTGHDERVFGVKTGYMTVPGVLGLKAGGYWRNNEQLMNISNHQSTVVLFNPDSGQPVAVFAANYLTRLRTAAAGVVAAKWLARPQSTSIGVLGAGSQAEAQIRATIGAFPSVCRVMVWNRHIDKAKDLVNGIQATTREDVELIPVPTVQEACHADIIITTTPSREALVHNDWISSGTHINAIGSDTKGKQELEPSLLLRARVVVDNLEQSQTLGELQSMSLEQVRTMAPITLGDIVAGRIGGRRNGDEITIFDSTGVTFQDLSVAQWLYSRALAKGLGSIVEL